MKMHSACFETSTAPVFKLTDLAHLYMSRMEQLGVVSDTRVNTNRLKQRLLAHFPDLRAHTKERDVFLVFDEDIGAPCLLVQAVGLARTYPDTLLQMTH